MIYSLRGKRSVETEIKHRMLRFPFSCINSDNYLVHSVARRSAFVLRSYSGFGYNFLYFCQAFQSTVPLADFYQNLNANSVLRTIKRRNFYVTVGRIHFTVVYC
jgi:hypothetical protein